MSGTEDRWLSVNEICKHLGASKDTVYKWIEKSKMLAHRMSHLWKFKVLQVDAWVGTGKADDGPAAESE